MFSDRMEKISRFCDEHELSLIKDGIFQHPCKLSNNLQNKLVACVSAKHIAQANNDKNVSSVITLPDLKHLVSTNVGLALSLQPIKKLYQIFEKLGEEGFFWEDFPTEISQSATIDPTAIISPKNVRIGSNTIISAGAIICPKVIIGSNCVIGEASIIGPNAFEVNNYENPQRILKQQGGVLISDNVEIQAKCTVVRATFGGFTVLHENVKTDCQVHIAHDCVIGKNTMIAACAEISGRVHVGQNSFLGPNCTISNGIHIGENAHVTLGAVVTRNISDKTKVSGNFAVEHQRLIHHVKVMSGLTVNGEKND